jgi:predicted ATPase
MRWKSAFRAFAQNRRLTPGFALPAAFGVGSLYVASCASGEADVPFNPSPIEAYQVVSEADQPRVHDAPVASSGDKLRPVVYKIVLTGGPCGGKSTAVSLLTRRLQSLGFQILIVPEAATLLFTGGARFDGSSLFTELSFEANKIRVQMGLEDAFMDLAKASQRPTVIICDRGTMDSRAYIGGERAAFELRASKASKADKFHVMLQQNNWTVQQVKPFSAGVTSIQMVSLQLRDQRYDAVFHLVTTAIGAEQFYSNASNATRLEDAKTAR